MPTTNQNNSPLAEMLRRAPDMLKLPREGELTDATLIMKGPRQAFFDLGTFGTGLVYGLEFLNAKDILKNLEIGAKVNAKVLTLDGHDGYVELSLFAAGKQKLWSAVKELKDSGEVIKIKITGSNSGGLTATIHDLKTFLPVSQLSNEHYPRVPDNNKEAIIEELKKFVGQELSVKVIDCNPRTNKFIISEREITDQNVKELLAKY